MATGTAFPLIYGPEADRLRRRATYASVAVAVLLIAVKFAAWLETGSVALLSSVIDSLLDAAASIINLIAVRHAMTPADREHRFGHGKAEPLAVLGQSAFITGSALLLLAEAVRRLIDPLPVDNPPVGVVVMVFSIAVTVALVLYQRHVVQTYRLDRDQRRRIALPQRRGSEPQRYRRAGPQRAVSGLHDPRPAVRCCDRRLDHLVGGRVGAAFAGPADGSASCPMTSVKRSAKSPSRIPR